MSHKQRESFIHHSYLLGPYLDHELRDDSVEDGSLVVKRLALLSHSLLTGTERTKVFYCLGDSCAK